LISVDGKLNDVVVQFNVWVLSDRRVLSVLGVVSVGIRSTVGFVVAFSIWRGIRSGNVVTNTENTNTVVVGNTVGAGIRSVGKNRSRKSPVVMSLETSNDISEMILTRESGLDTIWSLFVPSGP